jgi:hypothetical protein
MSDARFTIPPKLQWNNPSAFTNVPPVDVISKWLTAQQRKLHDRYVELRARHRKLYDDLAKCDLIAARAADDRERQAAFAEGRAPVLHEGEIAARAEALRRDVRAAEAVVLDALHTLGAAVLADRERILNDIASSIGEIEPKIARLRDELLADLDDAAAPLNAARWVRGIEWTPAFQPAQPGRDAIIEAFEQLAATIDDALSSTLAPIVREAPSVGDVLEHYGPEAAQQYAEQSRKVRTPF